MSRRDQYEITVHVTGVGNLGVFDTMTGGEIDSEELKYRPGGMHEAISLGGTKIINNVVVGRLFDLVRDLSKAHQLAEGVGRATVTVTKTSLDVDGHAVGVALVYTGKLKTVTFPEVDSDTNEAAMMTLEVSCAGTLGAVTATRAA
jgi:hypothetical protein